MTDLCFDLDGTLTDPAVGIARSFQHALHALGRPVPDEADLHRFIGPPMRDAFAELLDTRDAQRIDEAVAHYRARYVPIGMYENVVYPGVREGLGALARRGHRLFVVTSKPERFAQTIVEHFDLARHLTRVYGCTLDGARADKTELLAHVMAEERPTARPWMIGDRKHDVIGGRAHGLVTVGVRWGYGSEAELRDAAPDLMVASMGELCGLLAALDDGRRAVEVGPGTR